MRVRAAIFTSASCGQRRPSVQRGHTRRSFFTQTCPRREPTAVG
jgi:hypothetical protein